VVDCRFRNWIVGMRGRIVGDNSSINIRPNPRPAQLDFTVGCLTPISEGHSFHYAGAPYKYLYGGVPYKSPKIAENRRKSPKIRASGRPPRVTHITTDRKIKLRTPQALHQVSLSVQPVAPSANFKITFVLVFRT
jgi:hypothetical protein